MAKKSIPKDPTARREYGRLSVALHRAKKAATVTNIQNNINHHRQLLGMPPREFATPKLSRRGSQKLVYLPPDEELAKMSNEELTQWKAEERRKRKLQRAREKKMLEDAMVKELKAELADLERRVRELDDGARFFVQPVAAAEALVEDIITERSKIDDTTEPPVKSEEFVLDEAFQPEAVKSENDLDRKPKAIKNEFTISKVDTSSDGKTFKAELFSIDLDMEPPQEFDPIPLDPLSNATIGIEDFAGMDEDIAVEMLFKDDENGHDFQADDEFPITSTSDEIFEQEDLIGDNAIGVGDLMFGNSLVNVFDNGV